MIPFPNKKYQIIYADPPWNIKAGAGNLHIPHQKTRNLIYPIMNIEDIIKLPVKDILDENAVLFLWTINKYLEQSYEVARKWGFTPSTMLVWCKKPKGRGLGGTFGISTEYLLFSRKGTLKSKKRYWSTWFEHKRGKHSEKPKIIRDLIINIMGDLPRIELFARPPKDRLFEDDSYKGWDLWGDEVNE